MDIFLIKLHVLWTNIQLSIILLAMVYLFFIKRDHISHDIKSNKLTYVLLMLMVIFRMWLCLTNLPDAFYVQPKQAEYENTAKDILASSYSKDFMDGHDPRIYPIILSDFIRIAGNKILSQKGIILNSMFSVLALIFIFAFVRKLFGNLKMALIAAVLLNFWPLFIQRSVDGSVFPVSVFFCILSLTLILFSLRENSVLMYIIAGLSMGLASQIYYREF